jgi:hypothetical protein
VRKETEIEFEGVGYSEACLAREAPQALQTMSRLHHVGSNEVMNLEQMECKNVMLLGWMELLILRIPSVLSRV